MLLPELPASPNVGRLPPATKAATTEAASTATKAIATSAPAIAVTPTPAAGVLFLREALALLCTSLAILGLLIDIAIARTAAGLIAAVPGRVLLSVTLRRACGRFLHVVPTAVVVFLPAGTGVLVGVAVVSSIHVAAGRLAGRCRAMGRADARSLAASRSLRAGGGTVGIAGMLRVGRLAILAVYRLSP